MSDAANPFKESLMAFARDVVRLMHIGDGYTDQEAWKSGRDVGNIYLKPHGELEKYVLANIEQLKTYGITVRTVRTVTVLSPAEKIENLGFEHHAQEIVAQRSIPSQRI